MEKKIKMAFLTALEYSEKDTFDKIKKLENDGIDYIELLVPFSDPVAENPEIQEAGLLALKNGCNIIKIFDFLESIMDKTNIKFILSFYANTAYKYGYEAFSKRAAQCGIKGFIVEDLPYEEQDELAVIAESCEIHMVNIIAGKNRTRLKEIAKNAKGLICISPSLKAFTTEEELNEIQSLVKNESSVPVLAGGETKCNDRFLISI